MNLRLLMEEWVDNIKTNYNSEGDVFKNPSKKEIIEIANNDNPRHFIRFIADPIKKNVYFFNGERLLHSDVEKKLKLNDSNLLKSYSYYKKGKLLSINSKTFLKNNFPWIMKYFDNMKED